MKGGFAVAPYENIVFPDFHFDAGHLKTYRLMNNAKQSDFANILGIAEITYSRLESYQCLPSFNTFLRLMILVSYCNPDLKLDQFLQLFTDYNSDAVLLPHVPLLDKGYVLGIIRK